MCVTFFFFVLFGWPGTQFLLVDVLSMSKNLYRSGCANAVLSGFAFRNSYWLYSECGENIISSSGNLTGGCVEIDCATWYMALT